MFELKAGQPERWLHPYGKEPLSDEQIDRILMLPQFAHIDGNAFPDLISLRDIIRYDARIETYQKGDIVTLLGDYGSSAFFILAGSVRVFIDKDTDPAEKLRRPHPKQSLYSALAQLWRNDKEPEVRHPVQDERNQSALQVHHRHSGEVARAYLTDIEETLNKAKTVPLGENQMFGEISALARTPRTATIVAETTLLLVEMRWQGLRELRLRNRQFRDNLDQLYRERSLLNYLQRSPYFDHLDDSVLQQITLETRFETYGSFEWNGIFRKIQGRSYQVSPAKRKELIEAEPEIVKEGGPITGLIIVRQGFARISKALDAGHLTVDYLTADEVFGLEELQEQYRTGQPAIAKNTLRAIGYVDVLHIPLELALTHIVPFLTEGKLRKGVSVFSPQTGSIQESSSIQESRSIQESSHSHQDSVHQNSPNWAEHQAQMNFLVDNRIINGTAAMFINTDRCVNCDECVSACATNHNGNPRFIRHGLSHDHWSIANACMHCVDPVCLIGCPTGAINRNAQSGHIIIEDTLCIGCGTCAASCPYGNIRMVEVRTPEGELMRHAQSHKPVSKATKCDMCIGSPAGPACEQACPHDALRRVNMKHRSTIPSLDEGESRKRWTRRITLSSLVIFILMVYSQIEASLSEALISEQLLSGWFLVSTIGLLTLLSVRKKLSVLPLMKRSLWMQAHIYIGLLSIGVFGFHTQWRLPTGMLDTLIWCGFIFTTISGIAGLFLSRYFPKRLRVGKNQSAERLLFERIRFLRAELEKEFHDASIKLINNVASRAYLDLYQTDLIPYFSSTRNFWCHIFNIRYPIQRHYKKLELLNLYLDEENYQDLEHIRRLIEKKDNLDFQYALQKLLKSWPLLHIPLAFMMLVLPVIHVVVVYAFSKGAV
ncbi:MAG: hypothetical protein CMI12_08390 [Oceanospirillum sp.]|nr:hypothetical protein [Oceanospirillum sp.]